MYEGKVQLEAGPRIKRSIPFKALLIIGNQSIECDVTPQRLVSKEKRSVSITIPVSNIPESTDIITGKIKFNLTSEHLTSLYSDELSIIDNQSKIIETRPGFQLKIQKVNGISPDSTRHVIFPKKTGDIRLKIWIKVPSLDMANDTLILTFLADNQDLFTKAKDITKADYEEIFEVYIPRNVSNLTVLKVEGRLENSNLRSLDLVVLKTSFQLLNILFKWFGSNWPLIYIPVILAIVLVMHRSNKSMSQKIAERIRTELLEKIESFKNEITAVIESRKVKIEELDGIDSWVEILKADVKKQIEQEILSLKSSEATITEEGTIIENQIEQSSTHLQEILQTYNIYEDEPGQWESNMKAKYKKQLLKVGVKGIEDMGITDSYLKIEIEEQQSGNFRLIMIEDGNSEEKGYIFPVPWLHFNSTTLTDQLKPFYNLPHSTSEGIIEEVDQPAYVEKLADGLWEIVKKGKIRFKGEVALGNSISGTSAVKTIPAMI